MIESATTTLLPRARTSVSSLCEAKPSVAEASRVSLEELVSQLTRVDLHCHSWASNKPVNRAVGLLTNMPESYSPPEKVYDQAIARGMDLVTITDHDTIAGAMSLADRGFENLIIGQEVSVKFPEDGCLLHVLVWGLTPDLAEQIDQHQLRSDVYAFADWLRIHHLPHSFAHPLYVQNGKLTEWHLERAVLLFKGWETLNGAHSVTHRSVVERYLRRLTPAMTQELERKHGMRSYWTRPWVKAASAGSDDHALLNIGRTWTGIRHESGRKLTRLEAEGGPLATEEFLRRLMVSESVVGGVGGHASLLAHQLSTVTANWAARRVGERGSARSRYITSKLVRFAGIDMPRPTKVRLIASEAKRRSIGRLTGKRSRSLPLLDALRAELGPVLSRYPELKDNLDPSTWSAGAPVSNHDRMADFADELGAALIRSLRSGTLGAVAGGDRREVIDHALSYLLVQLAQVPYLFSLFHQNKERDMLERLEHSTATPGDGESPLDRPLKVLQFTDTLGDVNGVSRFIQNVAKLAGETGRDLTVVTSTRFEVPDSPNIKNFEPVMAMPMPKYEQLDAVVPPFMKMLRWAEAQRPDVIHVSTPGGVGVIGYIAAKMLRVPLVGTYHTDFPSYVDKLFDDHGFTKATELYMKLFYKTFARVFSRSEQFNEEMHRVGIDAEKMVTLASGIDTGDFGHRFEDRSIWTRLGIDTEGDDPAKRLKVLYVGRVSVEKNLPIVTQMWKKVRSHCESRGVHAELIVIGDGPYRVQMEQALRHHGAHFLGFRKGEELATLYASSDLFVFPSLTDTLGQAVMEAQASGLPALVSDQGGPKSIVRDGRSGYVLPGSATDLWVNAMVDLLADDAKRAAFSAGGIEAMVGRDIRDSFEHYWTVHEEVRREKLASIGVTRDEETAGAAN
jgi:glycosyltransferase involved in cell wall biosynthesis/predicted metal-dependent phosphoesterase TrpH